MQTLLALAIVGICAAYVVRTFVRTFIFPESAGCHCSGCPSAAHGASKKTSTGAVPRPRTPSKSKL